MIPKLTLLFGVSLFSEKMSRRASHLEDDNLRVETGRAFLHDDDGGGGGGGEEPTGPTAYYNQEDETHMKKQRLRQFFTYLWIGISAFMVLALFTVLVVLIVYNVKNPLKPPIHETPLNSTVILVSIDGFRAQYLTQCMAQNYCENLKQLVRSGVSSSKGFKPIFPSKTFPNHYSIVTGLHAESHGIVSNTYVFLSGN